MAANEYHKVGTTFRTSFPYSSQTVANTYVTGLVQGDFAITVAKNGVAGHSTAGITLTELGGPTGTYGIEVSGVTGFAVATGVYLLTVRRTAIIGDEWTFEVRVTSDGTGAGSWGDAAFIATAGDGRVTDGTDPLANATVRIVAPGGALYVQTTTDASGLFGPVYFSAAGTYTAFVQRSGFTTASGTITVSGSTATGPGTDLTLVASGTSTGLVAADLWARFKRILADKSGAQADDLARQGCDDALTMIAQERPWAWYETLATITVLPPYQEGTIAVTQDSVTVTLTGGTWPTWAAAADLYVNGRLYPVLTRDSGTQLTLRTAFGEASAVAASYTLAQTEYPMPSDMTAMGQMLFEPGWPYGTRPVSFASLAYQRSVWQFTESRPGLFAVRADKLAVWPWTSEQRTITVIYSRRPALLVDAADEADWDPLQLPVLRRAIEYQASLVGECVAGTPQQTLAAYRQAVLTAEASDRTVPSPPMADRLDYGDEGNATNWGRVVP
jgi:hypothetical protein